MGRRAYQEHRREEGGDFGLHRGRVLREVAAGARQEDRAFSRGRLSSWRSLLLLEKQRGQVAGELVARARAGHAGGAAECDLVFMSRRPAEVIP